MKRYLLDTSALLTLRDDEAGADVVADLLSQSAEAQCHGSFITPMELLYGVWKDEGEQAGRLAYEQAQALPITWVHEDPQLLVQAAAIKATHNLSLADAWIAASALLEGAVLVHKDPEFKKLDCPQLELPYKAGRKKS